MVGTFQSLGGLDQVEMERKDSKASGYSAGSFVGQLYQEPNGSYDNNFGGAANEGEIIVEYDEYNNDYEEFNDAVGEMIEGNDD